jgi:uncharacterized lipoprotein YajG
MDKIFTPFLCRSSRPLVRCKSGFQQHVRKFPVAVLFCLTAIGCGPSFKASMDVPAVKVSADKLTQDERAVNTSLYVDQFVDQRQNKALIREDKKEVNPNNDVAPAVVDALKQALQDKGFSFSESAPVIISGEVREWIAEVSGSLPTKIHSHAALFIEVLDPANKRIYSGVYKGYASMEGASIGIGDVRHTLSNSMEQAVKQVAMDKALISLLSSY